MRLGIDLDGVMCDFVDAFLKKVDNLYGIKLEEKNIKEPKLAEYINGLLPANLKRQSSEELYFDLCTHHFFRNLKPYDGAIDAVRTLAREHEIVFITRPVDYYHSTSAKESWLREHLNGVDYSLIFVNSFEAKRYINVDLMVDDDPRVLSSLETQIPVMVNRPWNENYTKWAYRINGMSDLVSTIKDIE
jgi:5'(3')-deoxyribonucleotidase